MIIEEILAGMTGRSNVTVKTDRAEAINYAIKNAGPDDIVLLAGKGHENYQVFPAGKIHFDDREVALEALKRKEQPVWKGSR